MKRTFAEKIFGAKTGAIVFKKPDIVALELDRDRLKQLLSKQKSAVR